MAPVAVEDAIKANCAALSNVMLVGDRRKFIGALVTFKVRRGQRRVEAPRYPSSSTLFPTDEARY